MAKAARTAAQRAASRRNLAKARAARKRQTVKGTTAVGRRLVEGAFRREDAARSKGNGTWGSRRIRSNKVYSKVYGDTHSETGVGRFKQRHPRPKVGPRLPNGITIATATQYGIKSR